MSVEESQVLLHGTSNVFYQKAEVNCYDSSTPRQTGNACKRLDASIANFLKVFLKLVNTSNPIHEQPSW